MSELLRKVDDALEQAEQASEWLESYVFGWTDELGTLPALATQRLDALFASQNSAEQLALIRQLFPTISAEHQPIIAMYIAGFPDEAMQALVEGDMSEAIERFQQLIDQQKNTESDVKYPVKVKAASRQLPVRVLVPRRELATQEDLTSDRDRIKTLSKDTLAERLRQLMQYFSGSRAEELMRLTCQWLEGASIDTLSESSDMTEQEVVEHIMRVSKILLATTTVSDRPRQLGAAGLEWQVDALCVQVDPELFFPEKGESNGPAKEVCKKCMAKSACLEYAMQHSIRYGVWGGLSAKERDNESARRHRRNVQDANDQIS